MGGVKSEEWEWEWRAEVEERIRGMEFWIVEGGIWNGYIG